MNKNSKQKIKSQKYTGVYYNILENGDKSYFITYKDLNNKKPWVKIGLHSDGIRESYCYNKRTEIMNLMKLGENPSIVKNKRTAREAITFGMIGKEYLAYKENKIARGSFVDINSKYKNHIEPYLANKDIETITKEDIENIIFAKSKTLSKTTLNMITDLIRGIFNYAIENGKCKNGNPAIKAHRYSIDNNRERFLSKEEIAVLLQRAEAKDTLTHLFTILALTTGGRLEALCSIQRKHINLSARVITLKDIKNNKTYNGYIKKEYLDLIQNHIKDLEPNDYILGSGDVIKQVQRRLRPILDDLFNQKLDSDDRKNRVVIHSLRHTFASQLIANNVPIFVVQKLMNHADIKMTMRYVNVDGYFGQDFVDNIF